MARSRLDSVIRRLTAQRECLNQAAGLVADTPGCVLELGLGNGRTFDHLRGLFPNRDIYVFERKVAAHPDCIPADDRLFLGDLSETLPQSAARLGRNAALVHADIGSGHADIDKKLAAMLADLLPPLVIPGGLVISDQDIPFAGATPLHLPEGVDEGRYYFRRLG